MGLRRAIIQKVKENKMTQKTERDSEINTTLDKLTESIAKLCGEASAVKGILGRVMHNPQPEETGKAPETSYSTPLAEDLHVLDNRVWDAIDYLQEILERIEL